MDPRLLERRGRDYFQRFQTQDDADIVADLEERDRGLHEYQQHTASIEQENRLPSVRDPKLFTIPCKSGAELETVVAMMNKSVKMAAEGTPLKIKSVFYNPSIRGFVYMEAYKEDYVLQACQGMRNLVLYRGKNAISSQALRHVPIKEMVQVMQASRKSATLKAGSWVRLKRGDYSGDLAQVAEADVSHSRALLKIVPRVDLQAIAAKREAQKNPPPPGQPRKRPRRAARAPQRLFNANDVMAAGGFVDHLADRVIKYNNRMYRDGYLFQWTKLDSMQTFAVEPSLEELQMFQDKTGGGGVDENGEPVVDQLAAMRGAAKREACFSKDDVVVVKSGELKNLKAKVIEVKTDVDGPQLHVRPMLEGLQNEVVKFTPSEVSKFFAVEDLSLIHISEPTRLLSISYAVFCLKKKKNKTHSLTSDYIISNNIS
eukprot:TRINITY_DN3338_c0_g1_i3.p1 TRINITY_DN3338_c0_g1~~TRINITY_DN3338_c0_g1_i3.p1  ORF type:complete len:429 (-),score=127.40 TRINITY_DN3338_c0_g1_i3:36-1322(-)